MGATKELKFPKNWDAVRKRVMNKEITAKDGYTKLGLTKSEYYKLVRMESERKLEEKEKSNMELSPADYFQNLKDSKIILKDEELVQTYQTALKMLEGYQKSGQEKSAQKLQFIMETVISEKKLVDLGVDTFVYRKDVERFISKVEKKVVKVIELKNYERPIPQEIQDVVAMTKDIFTDLYVVFTDYTGKVEKEVKKERREKDPILFGVFKDARNHPLSDRMYFLGDWVDDYCDLTLESLIDTMKEKTGETVTHPVETLKTEEDFRNALNSLRSKEEDMKDQEEAPEEDTPRMDKGDSRSFRVANPGETIIDRAFKKVRSILKRK